jgi:hypothetical protein
MTRRRAVALAVMTWLGCFAAGCGVTPQDHPRPLEQSTEVISPIPSQPSAVPTGTPGAGSVIYLLRAGRLVPVTRSGTGLESALATLVTGPTPEELAAGVRTAVPGTSSAITAEISGGIARLRLPTEFTRLDGAQQALAVAQLVYTITEEVPSLTGIRLHQGERELAAPTATGQLVSRPVTRADYAILAPA